MKRLLASILAVVLLGTMAISGFAAVVIEDEDIVSGTAQEWTSEGGSTVQMTADGHAVITVSEADAEEGFLDTPISLWTGSDITAILPEGYDDIDLGFGLTPNAEKLGWGVVGIYTTPEGEEIMLENTFDDGKIILFDIPGEIPVSLVDVFLVDKAVRFDDVPADAWFAKYFDYASAHGYIVGNGDGTVEPEGPISDAALYALLLRLSGSDVETTGEGWDDNARAAAVDAGFAIEAQGELTRAQAMEIVSAFIGEDAVEAGIFVGDEFGDLDEDGAFIRAHLAVISMRLVEFLNGYEKAE